MSKADPVTRKTEIGKLSWIGHHAGLGTAGSRVTAPRFQSCPPRILPFPLERSNLKGKCDPSVAGELV